MSDTSKTSLKENGMEPPHTSAPHTSAHGQDAQGQDAQSPMTLSAGQVGAPRKIRLMPVGTRAEGQAPASIGNVAVGFDLLGHTLEGPADRAWVTVTETPGVTLREISGVVQQLPMEPENNTAGRALQALLAYTDGARGLALSLEKGIALGSGMGGSAASAVAALVAAQELLEEPLSLEQLYDCAMEGEAVASGSKHGDNVAPMLLGGLVIAPAHGVPVSLPVPEWLHVALVHPHFELETRRARAVLSGGYALHSLVEQTEGLALVLVGLFRGDRVLMGRGLRDTLVEPRRAALIPGFAAVKAGALSAGALGASISGAGPSVFAWFDTREGAIEGAARMAAAFASEGLSSDRYVAPVAGPAARGWRCGT
ncbi:MAG: homoserine kinase [Myxococcota bacterium]